MIGGKSAAGKARADWPRPQWLFDHIHWIRGALLFVKVAAHGEVVNHVVLLVQVEKELPFGAQYVKNFLLNQMLELVIVTV